MNEKFQSIVSFIKDLYCCPTEKIPLHAPVFNGREREYILDCIDSTFVSSVGKYVNELEEKIAKYVGSKHAIAIVNGTSALQLALQLVGVEQGSEVITQAFSFVATSNAIKYCGAEPVFCDIDNETLSLSPDKVANFFEKNTKYDPSQKAFINKSTLRPIKAIVPMHTFGHPGKINELKTICSQYGVPLVEDAAESIGSLYYKKHTGTLGNVGILSFNGNKTITAGGGGMILTDDYLIAQRAKHLSTQAKMPHEWEFEHDHIGYNFRMPNINAALVLAQLEQIETIIESKRHISKLYYDFFKEINTPFLHEPENCRSNYWLNAILFKDKGERDTFLKYSNENGVMTRPAWKLLHELAFNKNCQHDDLTNSKYYQSVLVNIPSSYIESFAHL